MVWIRRRERRHVLNVCTGVYIHDFFNTTVEGVLLKAFNVPAVQLSRQLFATLRLLDLAAYSSLMGMSCASQETHTIRDT